MNRRYQIFLSIIIGVCFFQYCCAVDALGVTEQSSHDISAYEQVDMSTGVTTSAGEPGVRLSLDQIGRQGNWVKKREWLKQAQAVNDTAQQDVISIQQARKGFYDSFASVDEKTNAFYRTKGIVQGGLDALFADLQKDIAEEKKRRIGQAKLKSEREGAPVNFYDVQIEAIEDDSKTFERELAQFKIDLKAIAELDASLSERLKVLDKHIKEAGELGRQSRRHNEEIWYIIDDKKAREVYFQLKGVSDRIVAIKTFIQGVFLQDFQGVVGRLQSQIEQVIKEIASLERRGIVIEHRGERLGQIRMRREREKRQLEAQERQHLDLDDVPRRRQRRVAKQGWISWALQPFVFVYDVATWPVRKIYQVLFGTSVRSHRRKRRDNAEFSAAENGLHESFSHSGE